LRPSPGKDDIDLFLLKVAFVWFIGGVLVTILFSCWPSTGRGSDASGQQQIQAKDQRVAVLVFHAVDDVSTNPNSISLDQLEKTFQSLKTRGYHIITLQQFHDFIDGKAAVPPKAVLLTFDDGYQDIYQCVLPLTKKFNYPAVVFTVTKWFDTYYRPEPSHPHLSVQEAESLLQSGLWSIGGHTYDGHRTVMSGNYLQGPYYSTKQWKGAENCLETEAEYKARVWNDITLDRAVLKKLGVAEPLDFAFPYGAFNQDIVKMLNEAGYKYLYLYNEPGLNKPGQDPSYIYRIIASRNANETMALLDWYFSQKENGK
jgi:peptidoglycan/xylan/chitin deacetylase (PgdA/CDA1 family)